MLGVCFAVETAAVTDCQSKYRADTTSHSGYLASYMSSGSAGIGTPSCPWYISVGRGQRLNLTLFNFIAPTLATPGDSAAKLVETCYHVGMVRDGPDRRQTVTACSNQPRQQTILVSTSNTVSFEFAVRGLHVGPPDQDAHFLVHFDGQKFIISCSGVFCWGRPPWSGREFLDNF